MIQSKTTSEKGPFTENELKAFLATRKIVIASLQPTSVKALRKLAMQLGSKLDKTVACFTFDEAEKELTREPVHILITDLSFEKRSGLELIELQEKNFSNRLEVASIIMCSEPSSTESAMIVESKADAVILKPFTFENFRSAIYQSLANKVNPTPYWKLLEKGKEHFNKEEYEQAVQFFEESKKFDPKPTLALYYQGLIHSKKNQLQDAIKCYEEGLFFDQKNYLCLNAVFETYLLMKEFEQAYDAAKKLHRDYPVSTSRMLDLVKVSVYGKKYSDVIDYYEIFRRLNSQDENVCRAVIAGMLICAKYFALNSKSIEALCALKSASKLSLDSKILCIKTFQYFIETQNYNEAQQHHMALPEELKKQPECQLLYLALIESISDPATIVTTASNLLQSGIRDSRLYHILIEYSKKMGRSENTIKNLEEEAKIYFPEAF